VRVVKVIGGFGLLLAGTAMVFVPGPGRLTIAAADAREQTWQRRSEDGSRGQ